MTAASTRQRRPSGRVVAAVVLGLFAAAAILAPVLAPYDPAAQDLAAGFDGPSARHLLGTDRLGRDLLSRLLFGARGSLLAAVQAIAIAAVIGVPAGVAAALLPRPVDVVLRAVADAVLSLPAIVFALAIVAFVGPGLAPAMTAIGIVYAPRLFRVTRAAVVAIRGRDYLAAARLAGVDRRTMAVHHVLPQVARPVAVQIAVTAAFAILAESALSYLGLGAQPPTATWGVMVAEPTSVVRDHPEVVLVPGAAILCTVLALLQLAGTPKRGGG